MRSRSSRSVVLLVASLLVVGVTSGCGDGDESEQPTTPGAGSAPGGSNQGGNTPQGGSGGAGAFGGSGGAGGVGGLGGTGGTGLVGGFGGFGGSPPAGGFGGSPPTGGSGGSPATGGSGGSVAAGGAGGSLGNNATVAFLHHSTGDRIWQGGVPAWFTSYNNNNGTQYVITEIDYPDHTYGWENYPYDYWNIWVNHAGQSPYQGQDNLVDLTAQYDVIIFKHCYPASLVKPDTGSPDITSSQKRIENYELQYNAVKQMLLSYPNNRFLIWTGAAMTEAEMLQWHDASYAQRARQFFEWVKNTWDQPGDNIFVFDFFELETEGGIYLLPAYADGPLDSHPNATFSQTVAPWFSQRVVDVIEGRGDTGSLTGQ